MLDRLPPYETTSKERSNGFSFGVIGASFERHLSGLSSSKMADTPSVDNAGGGADSAIADMKAVFDQAIEKSAEITKVTTEKKTELDATKQRPQN